MLFNFHNFTGVIGSKDVILSMAKVIQLLIWNTLYLEALFPNENFIFSYQSIVSAIDKIR